MAPKTSTRSVRVQTADRQIAPEELQALVSRLLRRGSISPKVSSISSFVCIRHMSMGTRLNTSSREMAAIVLQPLPFMMSGPRSWQYLHGRRKDLIKPTMSSMMFSMG
jgi:hypothetical protein